MLRKTKRKLRKFVVIFLVILLLAFAIRLEILLNIISVNFSITASKKICSDAVNNAVSQIMADFSYNDLIDIVRNNDNQITSVVSNTVNTNLIKSEIVNLVQKNMDNHDYIEIDVPIGTLTDIQVLSGVGPSIELSTDILSATYADFTSEFIDSGINQTLHRITMTVQIEIYYITWSYRETSTIENTVLIAETIIVGDVPESYRNFSLTD